MDRFGVGAYKSADGKVQQAWLTFMVDLVGAAAGIGVPDYAENTLAQILFCTPQMEALVRWGDSASLY